jgi:hypothetical protein
LPLNFKDDFIKKLYDEGACNGDVILNLNREFNNFKTEAKNVINTTTNKQKIQMESIKWILEHAGLKGLSQRILLEDVTDMNKYNNQCLILIWVILIRADMLKIWTMMICETLL